MKKRLFFALSAFLITGLTFGMSYWHQASASVPGSNYLVSSDASGSWANSNSSIGLHTVSGDGTYVAFSSNASNLVPGDTNGHNDVFVKNTQTGAITLVDVDSSGNEAPDGASSPAISYDGRFVVFVSSDNLVSGVTGANIYRRDLVNGTTAVVSQNSSGVSVSGQAPDINADGRYAVFVTHFTSPWSAYGVVIKDMLTGAYQTLAQGRWDTISPSIDCDGHVVTYLSNDTLGVAPYGEDQTNYKYNLIYSNVDWSSNPKTYISTGNTFGIMPMPQVSCDGNMIMAGLSKYNRLTASSTNIDPTDNSNPTALTASTSDDGRYIAFASKGTNVDSSHSSTGRDTNYDVFVRDTKTGTTQLVSVTTSSFMSGRVPTAQPQVSLSPDGSTVAFDYASPDTSHTAWELISGVDTNVTDVYTAKTGF